VAARRLLPIAVATAALAVAAERGVWIDVPFVEQSPKGCGPAAARMLLGYWADQGYASAEAEIGAVRDELYSAEADGTLGSALEAFFERAGFRTFVIEGRWEDFETHLAAGRPLLVCYRPRAGQRLLHYAVAVGLDPVEDVVLLNDPARKKLAKVDRERFLRGWEAAGNWTLLAVPRP